MKVRSGALLFCLLSVCGAAPLTCDQLLTHQNHDLDMSGRWYVHAVSFDSCFFSTLLKLMKPSIALDLTSKETPKLYETTTRLKIKSLCLNDTDSYLFDNNASLTDSTEKITAHVLKSCSDCVALKTESILFLLSRKPSIDAADLKHFETQAECAGLPLTQQFDSDYDFENCRNVEDFDPTEEEQDEMLKKVSAFVPELAVCFQTEVTTMAKRWHTFMFEGIESVGERVSNLSNTIVSYVPEPVKMGWDWILNTVTGL